MLEKRTLKNALNVNLESGINVENELLEIRIQELNKELNYRHSYEEKKENLLDKKKYAERENYFIRRKIRQKINRAEKAKAIRKNNIKNKCDFTTFYFFEDKKGVVSVASKKSEYIKIRKLASKRLRRSLCRLRKKHLFHSFSLEEWMEELKKSKGRCLICNKFVGIEKLTIDHILPISIAPKEFIYTIKDVQPLCKTCNSKKKNSVFLPVGCQRRYKQHSYCGGGY